MSSLDSNEPPPRPRGRLARLRWPLMFGVPLVVLIGLAIFFLANQGEQSTDDAYTDIDKTPISTSIAGRVIEVDVQENQRVKAGQVLFRLDPVDINAAIERDRAALAAARLQVTTLRADLTQRRLLAGSAAKTAAYQAREADRQAALVEAGVSSRQQAAEARHQATLASDQQAVAAQQAAAALASLGGAEQATDRYPAVLQANAVLQQALIDLSHTTVIAPTDGVVTRVDQLQKGAYVNPAQTVFFLLSGQPWVDANFKENQLRRMRVGQSARVSIDALGGRALEAHVASFSPGAGSSFSPLPAQNATGNWVKVVQRLPVRIEFDRPPPPIVSRAGLSAKVVVEVSRSPAARAGR